MSPVNGNLPRDARLPGPIKKLETTTLVESLTADLLQQCENPSRMHCGLCLNHASVSTAYFDVV
jgi:hypothetical protein